MWVKICGCRTPEGVRAAIEAGADAVGFVLAESRRRVGIELARELRRLVPDGVAAVGVVHAPSLARIALLRRELALDWLQVSGRLPAGDLGLPILRTVYLGGGQRLPPGRLPRGDLLHLDRRRPGALGGTGQRVDEAAARRLCERREAVLAGGLDPLSVGGAIRAVRPFGVDVASGVETGGMQDPALIRRFVEAAREAGA